MKKKILILIVLFCALEFFGNLLFAGQEPVACKVYLKSNPFKAIALTLDKKTPYYIGGRLADGKYVNYFMEEIDRIDYSGPEDLHVLPTISENIAARPAEPVEAAPEPKQEFPAEADKRKELMISTLDEQEELLSPEPQAVAEESQITEEEEVQQPQESLAPATPSQDIEQDLDLARLFLDSGDFVSGAEYCRQVLAADSNNPQAIYLLGRSHVMLGNKEDALQQIDKLRSLDRQDLADELSDEVIENVLRKRDK
jgi:tetratricopeptide (TPR) repeat protein